MIRKYLCLIMLFFTLNNLFCQNKIVNSRNSVYVDFLGVSGTILSLNYDRILIETDKGYFNLNFGFGYSQLKNFNSPVIGIPLNINYTQGLKNHHIEIGTGLTYNSGMRQYDEVALFGDQSRALLAHEKSEVLFLSSRIGYKYQRSHGGILMRIGFTPLITLLNFSNFKVEEKILPLFDIGVGYAF